MRNKQAHSRQTFSIPEAMKRALAFHQQGNRAEAEKLYQAILAAHPNHVDALHFMGVLRTQQGRCEEAVKLISRALERNKDMAGAHSNLGIALGRLNRHEEAVASYRKAIAIKPDQAEAHNNIGNSLQKLGRKEEALASYEKAIAIRPNYAEALVNRGGILLELKRHAEAIAVLDCALAMNPANPEAWCGRGIGLEALGRHDEAITAFDRAVALRPEYSEAWCDRGNVLAGLARFVDAIASYNKAIGHSPTYATAFHKRGDAFYKLKRLEEALASYDRSLAIDRGSADVYYNRSIVLTELRRAVEALASCDSALAIDPNHPGALNSRGIAVQLLNRFEEAVSYYNRAIASAPDYATAYSNRGSALARLRRFDEAVESFERAVAIDPDCIDALANCATVQQQQNRYAEAAASFRKVLGKQADYPYALGGLAYSCAHICDWRDYAVLQERVSQGVLNGERVIEPFALLALSDRLPHQLASASIFVKERHPQVLPSLWKGERYRHDRIRVAYLSADFHEHATAYLMAELFERHDHKAFDVTAISFGPDQQSAMRSRLTSAFDRFLDVRSSSDERVARLLRDMEVDIAVDLKGYTTEARPGILAYRPAPIQVNYLGHPGTMGAEYIDYIIADAFVIPKDQQAHYAEKVIYLPDCYQVNDSKRKVAERTPTRAEAGLPEQGFVFCCFNNNYKITPQVFDIWMRLLRQIEGSVLWLLESSGAATHNLRREAADRGVAPERLVFAPRDKLADHLARHRLADLFVDTLPYNAHTTASDALWASLPIVTCAGTTFAGRVAGSLLHAVGLPEMVTTTLEGYEALALTLATEPHKLREIKHKLERNRLVMPLFNTDRFRRHIESAYRTMWERYERGEVPVSFSVAADTL